MTGRITVYVRFAALGCLIVCAPRAWGYDRYNSGCQNCHGAFTDATSTKGSIFPLNDKHEMHRHNSYMKTSCALCHTTGDNRDPFIGSSDGIPGSVAGLGCAGCHNGVGLRAHHAANGVADCGECHDDTGLIPPPESMNPPYYGTAFTRARNACNPVPAANTNENWTVGDFVGLDNDGNNVYDDADVGCVPRISAIEKISTNIRISFPTVLGMKYRVERSDSLTPAAWTTITNNIAGSGGVIQVSDPNAANLSMRFYRVATFP